MGALRFPATETYPATSASRWEEGSARRMATVGGQAVRSRDRRGELYETHALRALRFAYLLTGDREVAEDLMQDAFIRVFAQVQGLRDPDAFFGYLRTTILNLARARFRRQRTERISLGKLSSMSRSRGGPDYDVEERDRLWRALAMLPFRQRAALILRYYEDLSERDAARVLATTVPGIKALVSRGTAALRTTLERT